MSLHSVIRKTAGSYLFFVGILVAWLLSMATSDLSVYYMSVLVLTVSDPVASAVGMYFAGRKRPVQIPLMPPSKTLYGSLSFFFSALLLLAAWTAISDPFAQVSLFRVSAIAFLAAVAEAAGSGGADNVLIPAVVSFSVAISG
jgi:dolichol kinase